MSPRTEDDYDGMTLWGLGSISVLSTPPAKLPPPREFPIGFHVAAPGPSHEDDAPKRRQRTT